jgi:hypothetical protein
MRKRTEPRIYGALHFSVGGLALARRIRCAQKKVGLVLLLVSGVTAGVHAQGAGESIVIMPHDIVWKAPPVSPGPETAVIYGDPSKPGVYVMPHFHPDE